MKQSYLQIKQKSSNLYSGKLKTIVLILNNELIA